MSPRSLHSAGLLARSQRGMAVLGAMIVIVIVVSIATSIGLRAMHHIAATARTFEARGADGLFEKLERDSRRLLRVDARKERYDALTDPWASAVLKTAGLEGHGEGRLRDVQGLFNLRDISFDAAVVAQRGDQEALSDPDAGADPASPDPADGEDAALGGGAGGGLEPRPGRSGRRAGASDTGSPAVDGRADPSGESAAMMALAAVPGVASAGMVGAAAAKPGEGLALSPQQIALARFALLLRHLDIDEAVLPAILDWVDPDTDERFPNGAEDDFYSRLKPAYRTANRGFEDVSELKLVRGIEPEVFEKLRPFVTLLPDATAINVNTAPIEVLMSLGPALDRATATMIVETRKVRPFRNIAELQALPMLLGRPLVSEGLTVGSDFFILEMDVTSGQSTLAARTLLGRNQGDDVQLLSRDKGFF